MAVPVPPTAEAPVIGFAGLATSHPYTDAQGLLARAPGAQLHVWDADAERVAAFLDRYPGAVAHRSLVELVGVPLHGAIISARPPDVPQVLEAFITPGIPLFINKPAAVTPQQLVALDSIVRPIAVRVMSTSVVRFAPPVRALAARLDRADVLNVHSVVRHDVRRWLRGSADWQDDPVTGGGALATVGIHGVELLVSVLGTGLHVEYAASEVRRLHGLRSEDSAVLVVRWPDGVLATITVVGVAAAESYELTMETTEGPLTVSLPAPGPDPLGYEGTIEAFLDLVHARQHDRPIISPVPWEQTYAVLEVISAAVALTHPDG